MLAEFYSCIAFSILILCMLHGSLSHCCGVHEDLNTTDRTIVNVISYTCTSPTMPKSVVRKPNFQHLGSPMVTVHAM